MTNSVQSISELVENSSFETMNSGDDSSTALLTPDSDSEHDQGWSEYVEWTPTCGIGDDLDDDEAYFLDDDDDDDEEDLYDEDYDDDEDDDIEFDKDYDDEDDDEDL